jgi:hypothetical protein
MDITPSSTDQEIAIAFQENKNFYDDKTLFFINYKTNEFNYINENKSINENIILKIKNLLVCLSLKIKENICSDEFEYCNKIVKEKIQYYDYEYFFSLIILYKKY